MKKFNLFVMSLLATASFTLNSCSTDDTMSSTNQQQSVDGFYMTLQVMGSANGTSTRTAQNTPLENGTNAESNITSGTIYIYKENSTTLVYSKKITADDWKTQPTTQTTTGETKPIKVSVTAVTTGQKYNVYFLANKTDIADPLNKQVFEHTTNGGADYAKNDEFVMFNQNDSTKHGTHSTVEFTEASKDSTKAVEAGTIYLDRVVARIDAPTVTATKVEKKDGQTTTKNYQDYLATENGVTYQSYAVSNLNNNSYIMQNWEENYAKLVPYGTKIHAPHYLPYDTYGDKYTAKGLDHFKSASSQDKTYMFENSTIKEDSATALYFCIKANLSETAKNKSDFKDGTFYRYENKMYVSIADIMADDSVANPFFGKKAEDVVKSITGTDGKLIEEGDSLAKFRSDNKIEVYREGLMYYRYALNDNYYHPTGTYSVLRNSIYNVTVDAIYDLGKDVPNGPVPDDLKTAYFMKVKLVINPWVLNTTKIQLK